MNIIVDQAEFIGKRSQGYRDALSLYPDAWLQDVDFMTTYLAPKAGERILEIGAGSGYFSKAIATAVGADGLLVATDPSIDQLLGLRDARDLNIEIHQQSADALDLPMKGFDAVWSRGAIHHVLDKTSAFRSFAQLTRSGGRLVISDVFAGTPLARYFDLVVARTCCTGHEVAYLSREFASSLCYLTGWGEPAFHEIMIPWEFTSKAEIGHFLSLLHATFDEHTESDCLAEAERHLCVSRTSTGYALIWPTTIMVAEKASDQ